jgi:hypothetical protein
MIPHHHRTDESARKLSAELGDGQIRGLPSSELAAPPLVAMFTIRPLSERRHAVSPDTASDAVRGQTSMPSDDSSAAGRKVKTG